LLLPFTAFLQHKMSLKAIVVLSTILTFFPKQPLFDWQNKSYIFE
jgi:hypothetical protein